MSSQTHDYRPAQVKFAVVCIVASGVLQALYLALRVAFTHQASVLIIAPKLAVAGAMFLAAWLIYSGKNWARWVFMNVFLLGLLLFLARPLKLLSLPPFFLIYFCVQTTLQIIVILLLTSKPANGWFRGRNSAAA